MGNDKQHQCYLMLLFSLSKDPQRATYNLVPFLFSSPALLSASVENSSKYQVASGQPTWLAGKYPCSTFVLPAIFVYPSRFYSAHSESYWTTTPFAPGKTQIQKLHAVIFHTSCGDLLQSIRLGNQSRSPNLRQAVNHDKVMVTIPPMSY